MSTMGARIDFDADIFNCVLITGIYYWDKRKKHYEYTLRTLELFFRVEKKLPPYPRFLVMMVCFVVRIRRLLIFSPLKKQAAQQFPMYICFDDQKYSETDHDQAPPGLELSGGRMVGRDKKLQSRVQRRPPDPGDEGEPALDRA